MTGFGNYTFSNEQWQIKTEIKALNNKYLEINLRIPRSFKEKEMDVRQLLSNLILRGSVNVQIFAEKKGADELGNTYLDTTLIKKYFSQLKTLADEINLPADNVLSSLLQLPDVVKTEDKELTENDWNLLKNCIEKAFESFDAFRLQEGEKISQVLEECLKEIEQQLAIVEQEEPLRKTAVKNKLWTALTENNTNTADANRYEQELIFYFEKIDIAEEKSRLQQHIQYFRQTILQANNGKKLNFIAQEMGREINTMGSKAYHFQIQQAVVNMKEELEKIKEQLLNII